MITGKGKILLAKPEDDILYVGRWSAFSFGKEVEFKEAKAWPFSGGSQQIIDSEVGSTTYTLKLTTQSVNKLDLSHILDVKMATSTSVNFPVSMQTTVPATPFEVVVSGLTADQNVQVFLVDDTNPKFLEQVTTAPAAAGEYQITAGKIVFNSTEAGKTVIYRYVKAFTSVETLGVENATSYGYFEYSGIIEGPRMPSKSILHLGKIKLKGSFELAVADDVPSLELEYSIATPTGWNLPYRVGFGVAV
ncbi:hypothetical protein [Floridanema evergladense]|uniref:Minor tail protein n=1 Tax=Floridaenema evergladense BLCC-F167 TaxID=3153639 RepID=A0ABV4WD39_9CYAN